MENSTPTIVDAHTLKALYFQEESKLFSKTTKKVDIHIKSPTEILSSLTQKPPFVKVVDRYRLTQVLQKILLRSHLEWISYAYYRDKKLVIGAYGHIGQSELSMQKMELKEQLSKLEAYKDIETVSIVRDQGEKGVRKDDPTPSGTSDERSYGIFDNFIENEEQSKIIEKIKTYIINRKNPILKPRKG